MLSGIKVRYDGSHYTGTFYHNNKLNPSYDSHAHRVLSNESFSLNSFEKDKKRADRKVHSLVDKDIRDLFKNFYKQSFSLDSLRNRKFNYYSLLFDYVKECFLSIYSEADYDLYLGDERLKLLIKNEDYNRIARYKTLSDRVFVNNFNYFVTVTYDPSKFSSAENFQKHLKMTLSHFHDKYNWTYIMVFEKGGLNERVHAHLLLNVPSGMMRGELVEAKHYTFKGEHNNAYYKYVHKYMENTFFKDTFGINEFDELPNLPFMRDKEILFDYLTKYISKDNERFIYSRGLYSSWFYEYDDFTVINQFIVEDLLCEGLYIINEGIEKHCRISKVRNNIVKLT